MRQLKKRLLKQKLIYTIYNAIVGKAVSRRIAIDNLVPQVELKRENIQNLKTLLNRQDLLEHLPKNKVVAEIGVDRGEFSKMILEFTSPKTLHLIDAWEGGRYHQQLQQEVERLFDEEIKQGVVKLDIGLSTNVLSQMPDHYFDWVYLDTDHSYQVTKEELHLLKSKVKTGGIIAGHDYISYDFIGHTRYGVIEAVNEFCVNEGWEIIYLTSETVQYRSFAIRQIAV